MTAKTVNIQWLDTLRTLATLGVILIHVSSPLVNMAYGQNWQHWWVGNVADSAVRFAVPLFLMLSGATLLTKEYPLKQYYQRRFLRVLAPFLFWLVVYWAYRWFMLSAKQQPHGLDVTLHWALNLWLKEGVSKHFWYIYMILFIYLFVPFLGNWLRKQKNSTILILLAIWVLATIGCKSIPLNMYGWADRYGSKLLAYALHTGYLILGYYLTKLPKSSGKIRISAALIFCLTVGVSAICTYYFSASAHKLDTSAYGYLWPNTIIQSVALFVWIKELEFTNKFILYPIKTVSNYSYGIYLAHIIIIGILFRNGIYWKFTHPLLSLPVLTTLVLICSLGICYILRKIPFGKFVAG